MAVAGGLAPHWTIHWEVMLLRDIEELTRSGGHLRRCAEESLASRAGSVARPAEPSEVSVLEYGAPRNRVVRRRCLEYETHLKVFVQTLVSTEGRINVAPTPRYLCIALRNRNGLRVWWRCFRACGSRRSSLRAPSYRSLLHALGCYVQRPSRTRTRFHHGVYRPHVEQQLRSILRTLERRDLRLGRSLERGSW